MTDPDVAWLDALNNTLIDEYYTCLYGEEPEQYIEKCMVEEMACE